MTRNEIIQFEIDKLQREYQRLYSIGISPKEIQMATLVAMVEALRWSLDPKLASDTFTSPMDEWKFRYQTPEPIMVPTPRPEDYQGTVLEGCMT